MAEQTHASTSPSPQAADSPIRSLSVLSLIPVASGSARAHEQAHAQAEPSVRELEVPLTNLAELDQADMDHIRLFTDGVVWEDMRYELLLILETTSRIRQASFCVNDHNDLRLLVGSIGSSNGSGAGSAKRRYRYRLESNPSEHDYDYVKPFSLTCGFARVEIVLELDGGLKLALSTPDIISLSEPRHNGPEGESAEENNVRAMFASLIEPEHNQAAEWMFSPAATAPGGGPLSSDDNTDWSHGSLSLRLEATHQALDFIGSNPHDAPALTPLLIPMRDTLDAMQAKLQRMLAKSQSLRAKLERLLQEIDVLKGHRQSLPALVIVREHVRREQELLAQTTQLIERMDALFSTPGSDAASAEPTSDANHRIVPAQLQRALDLWEACKSMPLEREDAALHAIKPDRLFEYSALRKMLTWLANNGFRENADCPRPIDHFAYALAESNVWFENEKRCANTYHLARGNTAIDLYFQPVVYVSEREENGIWLHRVASDRYPVFNTRNFWTPDYMIVVRERGLPPRPYLIDAKYCTPRRLPEKLQECTNKYLHAVSGRPGGTAGEGVGGVLLLSGRLSGDEASLSRDDAGRLTGIVPAHSQVSWRKLGRLFEAVGVSPTRGDVHKK
ncbi:MAG: hypothetical protein Q4B54_08915 [Coriobacteriales bacterium]|nr:hypothetical protein [Coriobacteriales bacterium]